MNQNQDEKGRFKKGNTCGGRKKIPEEFTDAVLSYTNEALQTVVKIMKSRNSSPAVKLRAAQYILDRAFGYPRGNLEVEAEVENDGFLEALSAQVALVFDQVDEPKGLEVLIDE